MMSSVKVLVVRVDTNFDAYGKAYEEYRTVLMFDGTTGDDSITICNKAKEKAEELNKTHSSKYRNYITSRVD